MENERELLAEMVVDPSDPALTITIGSSACALLLLLQKKISVFINYLLNILYSSLS